MKAEQKTPVADEEQQPLIAHLMELRQRLMYCLVAVLLVFVALCPFANQLYSQVAAPLIDHLAPGNQMIATEVAATFIIPIKMVFYFSLFIVMPYLLYQIWAFIAPGLYETERRFALPLLVVSIMLFYIGVAFAFFIVFPLLFAFFTSVAPEGVAVMTDISRYLDFILKLFLSFGLAFEVPVATLLLLRTGVTTVASLRRNRPYIIVSAFILGMLLTPPDVVSQFLLAMPLWLLFELGLLLGYKYAATDGAAEE